MFIAHTGNHSPGATSSRLTAFILDKSYQRGRSSALGCRGSLHSRVAQIRCYSSHSNNVTHMRASAAVASVQLACEQTCVQDLVAQVAQTTCRKQQHPQRQQVLQHAVEFHRQQLNGQFSALSNDLQLGSLAGAVAAPSVDHQHLQQEHELQQQQQQGLATQRQHPQWLLVPQQTQHALHPDDNVVQQVQQHPVQRAQEVSSASLHEVATNNGRAWHQRRRQDNQQHSEQLEDLDKRADLLLQECSCVLDACVSQQRSSTKHKHPPLSWSKRETVQGWKYSQQDKIARTPAGTAVLCLSTGTRVSRQAKQLLSWLRREQRVILSVAGAALAQTALECLAQSQHLIQQHYPQYQLVATVDFHSSSRPQSRGRCQVYNLTCSLQDRPQAGVAQVQIAGQQVRQQPQQHHTHHLDSKCSSCRDGPSCDLQHKLQQSQTTVVRPGQLHWQYAGIGLAASSHHGLPVTAAAGMASVCGHHPAAAEFRTVTSRQQSQLPGCGMPSTIPQSLHIAACEGMQQCNRQQHSAQQRTLRQQVEVQLQEQRQQRWQASPQQQNQSPLSQNVQQVETKGSATSIADACDAALQHSVAVCVAVAYAKQAVKLLEAVAVLDRRCKQANTAGELSMLVMLQVMPGLAHSQSGSNKLGVHVLVSAAPIVQ